MHALPHDPHPRRTRRAVHVAGGRRSSNAARAPRSTARRPSRRGATTPHRHPAGRTFCRTFPPFSQPARSLHIPGGSLVACLKGGKEISPTERTDERLRVSSGAGGAGFRPSPRTRGWERCGRTKARTVSLSCSISARRTPEVHSPRKEVSSFQNPSIVGQTGRTTIRAIG